MKELKSWQKGILIAIFPALCWLLVGIFNIFLHDLHIFKVQRDVLDMSGVFGILPGFSFSFFLPVVIVASTIWLGEGILASLSLFSFVAVLYWIILGFLIGLLYNNSRGNRTQKIVFIFLITFFLILHLVCSYILGASMMSSPT